MHFSQYLYSAIGAFRRGHLMVYKIPRSKNRDMPDYSLLGAVLILAGIVVLFTAVLSSSEEGHGKAKAGIVLMVGPIPIIFGNDKRLILVAMAMATVLIVLWLVAGFW